MTDPKKSLAMMLGETLRSGGALLLAATAVVSNRYTWLHIGELVTVSVVCVVLGILIERKRRS